MAKLTDTQKSLIILGAGIVVAIGAGVGIYFDLQAKAETDAQIEVQKGVQIRNDAEIAKIPGLEKDLVAYKKVVADNARILPTEDDINKFIRDVGDLEKEVGISIRVLPSYTPTEFKAVTSITRIPMKMQLTATTRAFLRFLNQLENRERLVSVTDFRISPSSEDPKPGQEAEHEISMSFDLYRYDPKAAMTGDFPVKKEREETLLDSKEVKDLIAARAKPTSLERYTPLPGRDNRRDLFLDPRRRTGGGAEAAGDRIGSEERAELEALKLKYDRAKLELEAYRNAEKSKDFLRMAAAKRNFLVAREQVEEGIRQVAGRNPEFKSPGLQERYVLDVKRPYEKLMAEAADVIPEGGGGTKVFINEATAAGLHKELQELMDARKFTDAAEKWNGIDSLFREAGKNVDEGARPHYAAMQKVGEHARFQAMLYQKKIEVQGVVKMERTSAAIINGRMILADKPFDKETTFLRVEEGKGEDSDRLIFSIGGHEVDFVQPKPKSAFTESAILQQE